MTNDRYSTVATAEGHYVYDNLDERPIGEPCTLKFEASLMATRMNRRDKGQESIIEAIRMERLKQDERWGPEQDHDSGTWLAILTEEVGEVANSLLSMKDPTKLTEAELVQVAAVTLAWLEAIDRNR